MNRCIECWESTDSVLCDLCGLYVCDGCQCHHMTKEESLLYSLMMADIEKEQGYDQKLIGRFN